MHNSEFNGLKSIYHPITAQDLHTISLMKEQLSSIKGKIEGPEARKPFDEVMESVKLPGDITFQEETINGTSGWWCLPKSYNKESMILYLHGGAYNVGSAKAYRNFVGHIAGESDTAAFIPDYRLAPENPYPVAVEDVELIYTGLIEKGYKNITIAGDSAGGGLALILLARTTKEGSSVIPSSGVVFSPWTDLKLESLSLQSKAEEDILLTKESLKRDSERYLRGADPLGQDASPLYGDLKGLLPIQVHVGEAEVLFGDSLRYSEKAFLSGVNLDLHIWEGMPHVFPSNIDKLSSAKIALEIAALFVKSWQG